MSSAIKGILQAICDYLFDTQVLQIIDELNEKMCVILLYNNFQKDKDQLGIFKLWNQAF